MADTMSSYNIRDFGAIGDGESLDSPAIQAAIDFCCSKGGGKVICPAGNYSIGTIVLKDDVDLHLENGAVLKGSVSRKDYIKSDDGKEYLVYAKNAENISISGLGCIDGNGEAFFIEAPGESHKKAAEWRPRALVHFVLCKNIFAENITLSNPPCYTFWPLGCDMIKVAGIRIIADPRGPNTDGIDIDCCSDVTISDCIVDCGDDAIAIKSDSGRLGIDKDCFDIVVDNCILSSTCSGIRLGYEGDGKIKNCYFNNIIIKNTFLGIDFLVVHHLGEEFYIERGSQIEDISFSNIRIEAERPIHFWVGENEKIKASIRRVFFRGVSMKCQCGVALFGASKRRISDLEFQDVRIDFEGNMDKTMSEVPPETSCWGHPRRQHGIPYGLYARNVDNIKLFNVTMSWEKAYGEWQNYSMFENVSNAKLYYPVANNNELEIVKQNNSSQIEVYGK